MGMRGVGALGMQLLVGAATTGCVQGIACPAIGWTNTVRVEVLGAVDIAELVAEAPELSEIGWTPGAEQHEEGVWLVGVDMTVPDEILLRALDADGAVLGESVAQLEWQRVGGSERCGGPGEAHAVLQLG